MPGGGQWHQILSFYSVFCFLRIGEKTFVYIFIGGGEEDTEDAEFANFQDVMLPSERILERSN